MRKPDNGTTVYGINKIGIIRLEYSDDNNSMTIHYIPYSLVRASVETSEGNQCLFWKSLFGKSHSETIRRDSPRYNSVMEEYSDTTGFPFENLTMEQIVSIAYSKEV